MSRIATTKLAELRSQTVTSCTDWKEFEISRSSFLSSQAWKHGRTRPSAVCSGETTAQCLEIYLEKQDCLHRVRSNPEEWQRICPDARIDVEQKLRCDSAVSPRSHSGFTVLSRGTGCRLSPVNDRRRTFCWDIENRCAAQVQPDQRKEGLHRWGDPFVPMPDRQRIHRQFETRCWKNNQFATSELTLHNNLGQAGDSHPQSSALLNRFNACKFHYRPWPDVHARQRCLKFRAISATLVGKQKSIGSEMLGLHKIGR